VPVQPAASVATDLLPWVQIVGIAFTAISAIAAAFSARAALRTAGRADETSRRAVEALGRATMPVLRVDIGHYPSTEQEAGRGPVPVTLFVVNLGSNRGLLVGASVSRPDSVVLTAHEPMPMEIGSTAVEYEQDHAVHLHMGTMPRLLPKARENVDSQPVITVDVEFTDVGRVAVWRHRSRWAERVQFGEDGEPVYCYERGGQPEIESVSHDSAASERPVGWVRRTWRRFW
jgi:hypothetical protein